MYEDLKIDGHPRTKVPGKKSSDLKSAYLNAVLGVTGLQSAIDSIQFSGQSRQRAYVAEGDLMDALQAIRRYLKACDKREAKS